MANFRHDKKIRTVVYMVVIFLAGSLLAAAPPAKKATTCRETTRRVIKPFEDKVAKAIKALETYEEKNATLILTLQKEISLRKGLLLKFPEKQRADAAEYDRKINAARQAISDANTKAQKRLAELQKKLQQARDKKNKPLVASYKRSIESLRKSIAADKISAYSKELNIGHSVESWKLDIKARLAGKTKKMQDYQKKEVSLHFKPLSWSLNQKAMEEAIQKRETLLGEARALKFRHYLNILSWSYSGKKIDEHLAQQKAKLQDAKSRIAQGTFVLYVQRLSRRTDRNSVLALVAKAKQKYRKTHADWGTKTYSTYNKILHGPITNGEI